MPTSKKVFLSYSSKDRGLVTPVGKLLRASNDAVFQDCHSIPPGANWKMAIDEALVQSDSMYVFWCRHASSSDEVRKEYVAAIERGVAVVPVLLDGTPLNQELSPFQGVDFRDVAVHPRFSTTAKILAGITTLLASSFVMLLLTNVYRVSMGPVGAGMPGPGEVASLELSPTEHTFDALGETLRITVIAHDGGGNVVPGFIATSPYWFTRPAGIAFVDTSGLVTAVGNGEAELVARVRRENGDIVEQQARITVRAPWWSVAGYWLRQNLEAYSTPLTVVALVGVFVAWRSRRRRRKHAALATQILGDLQARAASPSGSPPPA